MLILTSVADAWMYDLMSRWVVVVSGCTCGGLLVLGVRRFESGAVAMCINDRQVSRKDATE